MKRIHPRKPLWTLVHAIKQSFRFWWIGYAPSVEPQGESPFA